MDYDAILEQEVYQVLYERGARSRLDAAGCPVECTAFVII
jgi:hypothetical protein